eukprot:UN12942
MFSCVKRAGFLCSLNRLPQFVTLSCRWIHSPMSPSQENRMKEIMELWDYELERNNAGAFGMQYIVSHPTTRIQNTHILKATSLFQQIMGYIAGAGGLSQAEIDLLCENQHLLCNYTFTSKVARNNLEIGAKFTDQQLNGTITKYINECGIDNKQHLVSGLYMCLCVSGSDSLGSGEIQKYFIVADKMGFSRDKSDKILSTYFMECELIASFNDIYEQK